MSEIYAWSTVANSNNFTVPDGFPEGMEQRFFNDCTREMMASLRRFYQDPEWLNLTSAFTVTRDSASTIRIAAYAVGGLYFPVGCRVLTIGGAVTEMNVTASTYSAPDHILTVDGAVPVGLTGVRRFIGATVRSAAFIASGTGVGQIPVNTSAAPLGTAAYKNHGAGIGDVPVNSAASVLKEGAYVDVGTGAAEVPTNNDLGDMALLDEPKRTYAAKSSDTTHAGTTEIIIPQLSNLAITGAAAAKKFRVSFSVHVMPSTTTDGTVTIALRVGTAGTVADALVYLMVLESDGDDGDTDNMHFACSGFQITTAGTTDKASLTIDLEAAGQTVDIKGVVPRVSFLEIVEIQE